jgi:hypothetical protein
MTGRTTVEAKKYIQDPLPIFGEPILVGDTVRLAKFIEDDTNGDDLTDIAAAKYIGSVGKVVDFMPDWIHPFIVEFSDATQWAYGLDELERL